MAKALWNGTIIAEADTDQCPVVEGNIYFPPDALGAEFVESSDHRTYCPWKGEAHYYNITVNGETNANAAWHYPKTKPEADHIRGYVAFWKGIEVSP